jgi:hypothetical protein
MPDKASDGRPRGDASLAGIVERQAELLDESDSCSPSLRCEIVDIRSLW